MKEHVLVVDDNRDTADTLARLIDTWGFRSRAVYSGEDAIQETARFEPDMALVDIGMPGLDGFETVKRIRQQRGNAHIIIVAVTGWTRSEDKQRAYSSGFDLHVAKPLEPETLRELLAMLDPELLEMKDEG